MVYKKETDYEKKIQEAAVAGDNASAAVFERQRNEKIAGEGLGYETTNRYQQYLPDTGTVRAIENFQNVPDQVGKTGGSGNIPSAPKEKSIQLPSYGGKYTQQVEDILADLANSKFSYDYTQDPLYKQYEESYTRGGQRAMQDTLAQVSSRTGGLASSYAGAASQQANERYMQGLSDKIPELQQMAYDMYLGDLDRKQSLLGTYMSLDDQGYNRFMGDRGFAYQYGRDLLGDQRYDREYTDSRSDYDKEWNYGVSMDQRNAAREELDQILASGKTPSQELLDAADRSKEYVSAAQAEFQRQNAPTYRGGGGGGSGTSAGGSDGQDFSGLFAAAQKSGSASSFIKQKSNYQKFGFDSVPDISDYENWAQEQKVDTGRVQQIYNNIVDMRKTPEQKGDPDFAANAIMQYASQASLGMTQAEAAALLRKFGYDPAEWMD